MRLTRGFVCILKQTRQIAAQAREHVAAQRLRDITGVNPLTAAEGVRRRDSAAVRP